MPPGPQPSEIPIRSTGLSHQTLRFVRPDEPRQPARAVAENHPFADIGHIPVLHRRPRAVLTVVRRRPDASNDPAEGNVHRGLGREPIEPDSIGLGVDRQVAVQARHAAERPVCDRCRPTVVTDCTRQLRRKAEVVTRQRPVRTGPARRDQARGDKGCRDDGAYYERWRRTPRARRDIERTSMLHGRRR